MLYEVITRAGGAEGLMAADDRIDGYAAAILELAKAEGELARIGDELFRIARAFESSNELRNNFV